MGEGKSTVVSMTKERMIILVKLCITLCGHTGVSHDNVHAVRNMDFHLPSGNRTLVDAQTIVEVIGNTGLHPCRAPDTHEPAYSEILFFV